LKIKANIYIILLSGILFSTASLASKKSIPEEQAAIGQKIIVQIELPAFNKKHQNPYFALWLSKANNEHKALVVIREKVKWLRDLKKFWRNIARENRSKSDAVTGATTRLKKLNYTFEIENGWQNISLEVAREHGKKELLTLPISVEQICVSGKHEIEKLCIKLMASN
jgi:hypothetical protein